LSREPTSESSFLVISCCGMALASIKSVTEARPVQLSEAVSVKSSNEGRLVQISEF
jgi:hypothetical protein